MTKRDIRNRVEKLEDDADTDTDETVVIRRNVVDYSGEVVDTRVIELGEGEA